MIIQWEIISFSFHVISCLMTHIKSMGNPKANRRRLQFIILENGREWILQIAHPLHGQICPNSQRDPSLERDHCL